MEQPANLVALLPHRAPMLLLDRAEMTGGGVLVAEQAIPLAADVLDGHFPGCPVWPGALLLEAMAQTTAIWLLYFRGPLAASDIPVLGGVDCQFLHPLHPGERVVFRTTIVRRDATAGLFRVSAAARGREIARARITAGIRPRATIEGAP